MVIQAIRYLKKDGLSPAIVVRLRKQLDADTKADWRTLGPDVAAWMQPVVRQIAET